MNKIQLIGRVTRDIELKTSQSGVSMARFTLAVNRIKKDEADFINCRAWRERAEFISRYFHKGSSISIVGTLQQNNWTDQQGAKRSTYEVVVDEVSFVDSAAENRAAGQNYNPYAGDQGAAAPAEETSSFEQVENEDDLPF